MDKIDNVESTVQDIPETSKDSGLDLNKRRWLAPFLALSSGLAGCIERSAQTKTQPTETIEAAEVESLAEINAIEQAEVSTEACGCMPGMPGSMMPPAAPVADPAVPATPQTGVNPPNSSLRNFSAYRSPISLSANMMQTQTLDDGSVLPVWGFSLVGTTVAVGFNNDRMVPSPVIEVTEGEQAAITLNSGMPHTIHLHGLDVDQNNDGVPATSGYVGMPVMMGNFGRVSAYRSLGQTKMYTFPAPHAGTYMYHCHVDTVMHMEMGMAGTIIVRPSDGNANTLWTNGPFFDREYIWQLHTYERRWHGANPMFTVSGPAFARYNPDTFLINGSDGNKLLTDPATALRAAAGEWVLIRLVNLGYQPAEFQLGEIVFEVLASDGRPLAAPLTSSRLLIGPGERYDIRFEMPTLDAPVSVGVDYLNIMGTEILGSALTDLAIA